MADAAVPERKLRLILVYTNLGIGGIAKSLIELLNTIDPRKYEATVYIRRDDVLDLLGEVPAWVNVQTVHSRVKSLEFETGLRGKIAAGIYALLRKRHAFSAKRFFEWYEEPIQRKREKQTLGPCGRWDVAVSYSTDGDDPIFVKDCVPADRKYAFIHQSTAIAKNNRRALRKYDGVVVVNPDLVSWAEKLVRDQTPVRAIGNHVSADRVRQLAKEPPAITQEKPVLVTCGRICRTKGADLVAETARLLKESGVPFVWYWVGDGPDRDLLEQQIEAYGLQNELRITGFLQNPFPYVSACTVYLQPSRAEACPLAIMEALMLCRPVLGARNAGTDMLFRQYGCGFTAALSPDSIAAEIRRLLGDPALLSEERLRLKAIDWATERDRYERELDALFIGPQGR